MHVSEGIQRNFIDISHFSNVKCLMGVACKMPSTTPEPFAGFASNWTYDEDDLTNGALQIKSSYYLPMGVFFLVLVEGHLQKLFFILHLLYQGNYNRLRHC